MKTKNRQLKKRKFIKTANKTKLVNTGIITRRGGFRF